MGVNPISIDVQLPEMGILRTPSGEPTRIVTARGAEEIVTFLRDGSDEQVIDLSNFRAVFYPTWSPDGSQIAFQGGGPGAGSRSQIWIVNHDGTGLRQLTNFVGSPDTTEELTWSPDGSLLAFQSDSVIYTVDAATGTDLQALAGGSSPAWSPDGSMIAFSASGRIRVMRKDGSSVTTLSKLSRHGNRIDWSPDGSTLAIGDDNWDYIWLLGLDGNGWRKIASDDDETLAAPTWSPDGCEVFYFHGQEPSVAAADGSGYTTARFGFVGWEADWSFSPSPVDVPADLAPRVKLIDPIGGELAEVGATYTIRWEANDDNAVVSQDLYLSVDGVITPIITGLSGSARSFVWAVPNLPTDPHGFADGARIRVVVEDSAGQKHSDTSKYGFAIAGPTDYFHSIRLTAPTGQPFDAGDTVHIAWEATERSLFPGGSFTLELSLDGGRSYSYIIEWSVASTERFHDWLVPAFTTAEAVIRIRWGQQYAEGASFKLTPSASPSPIVDVILYGVRNGGDANLTWSPGGLVNIHRASSKTSLPSLWSQPPIGSSLTGQWTDPAPPPAPAPWYYQIFGTSGCTGASVP